MTDILSRLAPPPGSRKSRKRLGRGAGSGLGKTSGKGHKGLRARAGAGPSRGFEGGQMPLQRRLPKRGFKNPFRKEFSIVNVEWLECFEDGAVIDPELLVRFGMVDKIGHGVKILGKGEIHRKLTVKAHAFSAGAIDKIQKAGGAFEQLPNSF